MDARKHLGKGIMRVMRESPFYTTIILKHDIIEQPCMNAVMATDGKRLLYNPNMVLELNGDDLQEILKHEAMHVANQHHVRAAELKKLYAAKCKELQLDFHKMFNVAADLAINSLLYKENEKIWNGEFLVQSCLPEIGMFSQMPHNKTAEWYFKKLLEEIDEMDPEEREKLRKESQGEGAEEGESEGEVTEINADTQIGVVSAAEGDLSKAKQETMETLARAAMASKGASSELGSAKSMIATHEAPAEINWRSELQTFFTRVVRGRPNYRRPNRRHQSGSLIFPSNKHREVSEIAFLVDMSGSMSNESVATVYTHISEIVKANRTIKVRLVPFDGDVFKDDVKIFDASNVPIKETDRSRLGWGGTKFMPPIRYAEALNPSGIIMLTDCLPCDSNEYMEHKSNVPFLCLSVLESQFGKTYQGAKPEWCRTIEIKV